MIYLRLIAILAILMTGCVPTHVSVSKYYGQPNLSSIHIIDRNGMTEAVSNPERLKNYENVDFLATQPYQKVLRIYSRDVEGNIYSYITTYHANGQLKQYLEIKNNRAFGFYQEWYQNGNLKVEATLVEGDADISLTAEKSWQFDGCAKAYDENENLMASIEYSKGTLEGVSTHYHPNGKIWKEIPYSDNNIDGEMKIYLESGELFQSTHYCNGIKEGLSLRYWPGQIVASEENYKGGFLISAVYKDICGKEISSINNGEGFRSVFSKDSVCEEQEFHHGLPEGSVKSYDIKGYLTKIHHVKNGLKHGEEIFYFPITSSKSQLRQKLFLTWYEGKIQGVVKTWYENGSMESQKELSHNKVNGLSTAWYRDGQLMMIEEYENGVLKKGDYFRKGERKSISQVDNGEGIVTFFDPEGAFIRKVNYHHGKPDET